MEKEFLKESIVQNPLYERKLSNEILSLLPVRMHIYQRASLNLQKNIVLENLPELNFSDDYMNIGFGITGEIKGFVFCKANIKKYSQDKSKYNFLQGLFVESMNIILGKLLTNIENSLDLMCYLTPPKILRDDLKNKPLLMEVKNMAKTATLFQTNLSLDIDHLNIPCELTFELQESFLNEVQ
jgi:hypothetical protein